MPRIKKEDSLENPAVEKAVRRGRKPAASKAGDQDSISLASKAPARIAVKKEEANSKKEAVQPAAEKQRSIRAKKPGPIMSAAVTFVLTAIVVGGGIYFWANRSGQNDLSEIQEDARETRISFEQKIQNITDQLTGVKSENEELKSKQDELSRQAELLRGAKKEFYSPDLGLSFEYPAIFGNVSLEWQTASTGSRFIGTFSNSQSLSFTGISRDFQAPAADAGSAAASSSLDLKESLGFTSRRDVYYLGLAGYQSVDYAVKPIKSLKLGGAEALLLDAGSFDGDASLPPIEIGAPLAALVNLDSEQYSGALFLDANLEELPQEDFVTIIESVLVE